MLFRGCGIVDSDGLGRLFLGLKLNLWESESLRKGFWFRYRFRSLFWLIGFRVGCN